jgi:uncharacterized protein (DUF433 family)
MGLELERLSMPLIALPDGTVRVTETRVPLETIVYAFCQGATPEAIADNYPKLTPPQIYTVLAFYLANRQDVNLYVAEQAARSEEMRRTNEACFDPISIRARLLAREQAVRAQREGFRPEGERS